MQNGTENIGWSGDAHTLATTVNRDRGDSETGCWRASTRLAACAVALLSPRRPVAGLIKQTGFGADCFPHIFLSCTLIFVATSCLCSCTLWEVYTESFTMHVRDLFLLTITFMLAHCLVQGRRRKIAALDRKLQRFRNFATRLTRTRGNSADEHTIFDNRRSGISKGNLSGT